MASLPDLIHWHQAGAPEGVLGAVRVPPRGFELGRPGRMPELRGLAHSRRTLLHVVDEGLQLGVRLRLLSQGVQEQVVLRGACYVGLPQPPLQQPDLGLLLCHLQPLRARRQACVYPPQPGILGTLITTLTQSAPKTPRGCPAPTSPPPPCLSQSWTNSPTSPLSLPRSQANSPTSPTCLPQTRDAPLPSLTLLTSTGWWRSL